MIAKYYEILGVTSKASLNEIKKAFRTRAKQLHPDVNKSPDANRQFILLLEAYEYLVNSKTGKVYDEDTIATRHYSTYQRWQDNEAARARHRAEYYSRVNYQKFSDSEYYKTMTSFNNILGYVGFFISFGILVLLPLVLTSLYGATGFWISLLAIFITSPFTIPGIRSRPKVRKKDLLTVARVLSKSATARLTGLSFLNIFLLLKIGFQTLIPFDVLLFVFGFAMAVTFFMNFSVMQKTGKISSIISFCYCPLILNLLLVINFVFAVNPVFETYSFTHREGRYGYRSQSRVEKISYIDLENNTYSNFNGIRMFSDFDSMKDAHKITYKFEDGLLGFRVMKDFQFE